MKLVEVMPLISVKSLANLSYFSSLDIEVGDLVETKIGNRKVDSLVTNISDLSQNKLQIRQSDFKLRKIENIKIKNYIDKNIILSINESASMIGTSASLILNSYIPLDLRISKLINLKNKKIKRDINFLDLNRSDAMSILKQKVRERRARGESLFVVCPTIISCDNIFKSINQDKDENIFIFHSEIKSKDKDKLIQNIQNDKPICIVSTPSFVGLFCSNLSEMILIEEESKYFEHHQERVNFRDFIFHFSEKAKLDITLCSICPSLDSYNLAQNLKQTPFSFRVDSQIYFIRMNDKNRRPFSIYLSHELKVSIDAFLEKNKKIVLYTQRKGLSSSSVCSDCGHTIKCKTCDKDYSLFEKDSNRYWRCNTCKTQIRIEKGVLCENCGSFRIETLGVGTQGVTAEIQKLYPESKIYTIDSDHVRTKKEAIKIYRQFEETGGILIGTEMMLPLIRDIDLIGIISLDSYFSLPEYKIEEDIFIKVNKLISSLGRIGALIIQSRVENDLWESIKNKNFHKFYQSELKNRKLNNLPPYTYMISIDTVNVLNLPEKIQTSIISSFTIKNTNFIRNIFLIEKETWEDEADIRSFFVNNFLDNNLQVNPRMILKVS